MRRFSISVLLLAGAAGALAACSEDLSPATPDASTPGAPDGGPASRITTVDNGDGSFTSAVDATSMTDFVGFDFQSQAEVPLTLGAWDVAFKRFQIESNGGTSGTGGAGVAVLPGADFDALAKAPAQGYISDTAEALAFDSGDDWYSYDPSTHVLTPRDVVFVVLTPEGVYFKVKMLGYYDGEGTSGHPSFKWAPIAAPTAAR